MGMDGRTRVRPAEVALALGGPVVMGGIAGMPGAIPGVVYGAVAAPAIVAGVAAATLPALYIGTSMAGAAPPAAEIVRATIHAGGRGALALFGLAAPAAFLIASTSDARLAPLLALVAMSVGGYAALRHLWTDFVGAAPEGRRGGAGLLFVAWAVIASAIGARLLVVHLAG